MDAESHAVLFEKNADELTAPASMAKTMTAEVVFNEIKNGRLNFDSEFMISENAWRKGEAAPAAPPCSPGSTPMFGWKTCCGA